MSVAYIGQQLNMYVGCFLVITGVFGNVMNVFIFVSARNYRTTPCTFYFLMASIFNIAFLTINVISRTVTLGFGIDLTKTSSSWCKSRFFFLLTLDVISLSCSCLATIDQFFATSQSARLRRLSNIKWTRRIVIIVIIIGFLQEFPFIFTHDISPITGACTNSNPAFPIYLSVHILGLNCAIPIMVMTIFGYLGYHNIQLVRALAEQRADRQLVRTILIHVVLVIIDFLPYGIYTAYSLITATVSKDSNQLANDRFALTITTLLYFFYFAGSGYTFMIASSRFRRSMKHWTLFCFRSNRVDAFEHGSIQRTTMNNRAGH